MSIDQAREGRANLPGIVAAMFSNATVDRDYAPYGLFLLRISLGFDWLVHAFLKISRGMHTHEALLAKNGITPLLAWPTFGLEVIGGVAILLGWYTRQWAAIPADIFGGSRLDQMAGRLGLFQSGRRLGISDAMAGRPSLAGIGRQRRLRVAGLQILSFSALSFSVRNFRTLRCDGNSHVNPASAGPSRQSHLSID